MTHLPVTTRCELPFTTPLPAASDAAFERFVRLVRRQLAVPVALVSLVDAHEQVFPGAAGLPEPWQTTRRTPLTHSFCQHVVTSASPLVIEDARTDARVHGNLAVPELGVVAYAGMPLTDADGRVIGSLCAIDDRPRRWTADDLAVLADLAEACSSELQLRALRDRRRRRGAVAAHRGAARGAAQRGRDAAAGDAHPSAGARDPAARRPLPARPPHRSGRW